MIVQEHPSDGWELDEHTAAIGFNNNTIVFFYLDDVRGNWQDVANLVWNNK